ncbi:MAG TPA: alpha/beta fold hydrolase [Anaerolineales bacterium]|nr:alpha/beta fold hydrolase [Anaerolineales bacterium]
MLFYPAELYSLLVKNILSCLVLIFVLTACGASASPTLEPVPPTPPPMQDPQGITFTTPDGATIEGTLYGSGDTAVIFSVMGDCTRGWEDMADLVAHNGMIALTYSWRGCKDSGSGDADELQKFVDDLRGAIDFMRGQGATKLILAGASLGGCASAKLMVESQADGLIVMASPPEIPEFRFAIEAADMNADIPKLFITAENDNIVPAAISRQLFDLAAEPKVWQTYPGAAHGTDLFDTEYGEDVQQRILQFILAVANP